MSRPTTNVLAASAAALLLCAGCATSTSQDSPLWAEPGTPLGAPAPALCDVDPTITATAQDAVIVTGSLVDDPEVVGEYAFAGTEPPVADDGTEFPVSETQVHLWRLDVSDVAGVDTGLAPGDVIYIVNNPWLIESDVRGVAVDLERVLSDEVVVLLSPDTFESASHGEIYWLADECQVGASFFALDDDGALVQDPKAKIRWGTSDAGDETLSTEEQLGVDDATS